MPDSLRPGVTLHRAHLAEIAPRTLYLLVKLRQDVFTMEQKATDPDLDGRDLEETTTLLWIEQDGEPAAHARLLDEGDGTLRIGRLAVRARSRRDGLGGLIMRAALDLGREIAPAAEVHIDAQAYLEQWYRGLGFETVGPVFMEAGIEHVAMVRRQDQGRG